VVDQVPKLLGVHFPKESFAHNLLAIVQALPDTPLPTAAVGILLMVLLVVLERWLPHAPAPLIALAVGIAGASARSGCRPEGSSWSATSPEACHPSPLPTSHSSCSSGQQPWASP